MTYGLFALGSGTALAWYSSPGEAYEAVRHIAQTEPEAVESLGLLAFDDDGHPGGDALEGAELIEVVEGGTTDKWWSFEARAAETN